MCISLQVFVKVTLFPLHKYTGTYETAFLSHTENVYLSDLQDFKEIKLRKGWNNKEVNAVIVD